MINVRSHLSKHIGVRVKQRRGAIGWTLDDLAAESGVSRRMIVNVEQGSVNASIGTLLRISDALGVGIPALVAPERVDTMALTPTDHGAELWRSPGGGQAVLLGGTAAPDVVELWEWKLAPGDRHDSEAHMGGTSEIAHVREGSIRIETSTRAMDLNIGDTLVFDSDTDHAYVNNGTSFARFTLVVFEPGVRPQKRMSP